MPCWRLNPSKSHASSGPSWVFQFQQEDYWSGIYWYFLNKPRSPKLERLYVFSLLKAYLTELHVRTWKLWLTLHWSSSQREQNQPSPRHSALTFSAPIKFNSFFAIFNPCNLQDLLYTFSKKIECNKFEVFDICRHASLQQMPFSHFLHYDWLKYNVGVLRNSCKCLYM